MGFAGSKPKLESPTEIFQLKCYCELDAKLRVSRTSGNQFRLFYNCPKNGYGVQCGFFQWSDELLPTGDKHLDEINLIRDECIRLQERIDLIREEHSDERAEWYSERAEIISELTATKRELDEIKKRIKLASDLDLNLMPPCDSSCDSDDEKEDSIVEKHTI